MDLLLSLDQKVDPRWTAVVVIDVQNDFCHPDGSLPRHGYDLTMVNKVLPDLHRFLEEARAAGVRIIRVQAIYSPGPGLEPALERRIRRGQQGTVCAPGSWGAEFSEGFAPQPGDLHFVKNRYSAFLGGPFREMLDHHGFRTLIMTGVATNVCVESTLRDGYQLGYYIVVPRECVAAHDSEAHEVTLFNVETYFGVVTSADAIVGAWRRG